jgi:hypothetical protein
MTPEQLLRPRYKSIADYPSNILPIDHITDINGVDIAVRSSIEFFDRYPHLFKKLDWWEDRKIEEMPSYLKQEDMIDSRGNSIPDKVIKVSKHWASTGTHPYGNFKAFSSSEVPNSQLYSQMYFGWEPATEEEYNNYTNKNK